MDFVSVAANVTAWFAKVQDGITQFLGRVIMELISYLIKGFLGIL